MRAAEARKIAKDCIAKLQRDHEIEYKATMAREKKHAAAVWKERGDVLVAKIDRWIADAAAKGHHGTFEPSTLNPNGDEVIWLEDKGDWPIHDLLMEHYRGEGYTVEEYQNHGMKITW
jgi:hypothetical protein